MGGRKHSESREWTNQISQQRTTILTHSRCVDSYDLCTWLVARPICSINDMLFGCYLLSVSKINQGLDDIFLSDENGGEFDVEDTEGFPNHVGGCNFDAATGVNGVDDLWKINMTDLSAADLMRFHFSDLGAAFLFYNHYASTQGFSARKGKVMKNIDGEITQQIFVCHRQGFREIKDSNVVIRKREPKLVSRCGCDAMCKVHIDGNTGRWYIKYLNDVHNHEMIDQKLTCMLPAHRKISEYDKLQMKKMREVGIKTPHIYGLIANQVRGYHRVRFRKQDLYNEQLRDRQSLFSDAKAATKFLEEMRSTDDMLYWTHTVDEEGRLQHLFWSDGTSRTDYSVFGDVLAFDATYKKNKYLCPLVVFSGVNHHNQSIIFASAIVGNETEETYVWLLNEFLSAMGGKCPMSVITDGDLAMKNAIKKVFPHAHHRLCAWHLIRNATSNIKNPKFVAKFKNCMLGDYDVGEFRQRWESLVAEFGLEDNSWVSDMYDKRKMWATAHIRGNFFGGFRTTSRCEGLHSEFGKYVNIRNNLVDFLRHFVRWLHYMRHREVEAEFTSMYGEPVIQTQYEHLEMSAANVYTKALFHLFRPVLVRAITCMVDGARRTATSFFYTVCKYRKEGVEWRVSYTPTTKEFKCSCMRLETFGIPCEHIVTVMVKMNIVNLPETIVYKRWTKGAKDSIGVNTANSQDPRMVSTYFELVEQSKLMAKEAFECGKPQLLRETVEMVYARKQFLKSIRMGVNVATQQSQPSNEGAIGNPLRVRTKGCGGPSASGNRVSQRSSRRAHKCSVCGQAGHNKKSCHVERDRVLMTQTEDIGSSRNDEDETIPHVDDWPSGSSDDEIDEDEDGYFVDMVSACLWSLFVNY